MLSPGATSPKPGALSISRQDMFWCGRSEPVSVLTSTATRFDVPPLVIHIFCPLTT